jgi:nucleotide-binding universal stress UspA family protein
MKILLAVDGSKFSRAATQAVIAQAKPGECEVLVLHVVDLMRTPFPEMAAYCGENEGAQDPRRATAEALVERTVESLGSKGLQVTTAVAWGDPRSKIIDDAAEWHADLIVLGSHGCTGLDRFLMGSVSDAVLHHAQCSVELVRILPQTKGSGGLGELREGKMKKILLAIDDSKFSEAATQLLVEQARPNETEVRVLHVVEPPSLLVAREMGGYDPEMERVWEAETKKSEALVASTAAKLTAKGINATGAVEQGHAKSKILDMGEQWPADLIVMGSHGRKGLERFLMGSVSETVARHAVCSVEIARLPSRR